MWMMMVERQELGGPERCACMSWTRLREGSERAAIRQHAKEEVLVREVLWVKSMAARATGTGSALLTHERSAPKPAAEEGGEQSNRPSWRRRSWLEM